jgi:glycosyltransferase involved in cell wall biosynthesis
VPGQLPPEVSVVVPTRDRPASLARCLAALCDQRGGPLEILVVDDGSRDGAAVRAAIEVAPDARLVESARRGPAAARNAGARAARAPVVCFTDDDCEPEPGWTAALASAIAGGAPVAAGRTVNADPGNRLAEASQHVANFLAEDSERAGPPFAASNNLAARREVFERLPFDESFPLAAGEDRAWCARLPARGLRLVHVPDAVVRHRQDLDARRFWRQHARYGEGARRYARQRPGALPSSRGLYPRLIATAFGRGLAVGGLVCLAQVATAAGYVRAAARERSQAAGCRSQRPESPP